MCYSDIHQIAVTLPENTLSRLKTCVPEYYLHFLQVFELDPNSHFQKVCKHGTLCSTDWANWDPIMITAANDIDKWQITEMCLPLDEILIPEENLVQRMFVL